MIETIFPNPIPTSSSLSNKAISDLIQEAILAFNLTEDLEVEIMFVSKNEIAKLNKLHRKIDKPTDVLSFPQSSFKVPRKLLGSIVISDETVAEKSEDMSDVIKHGLLHLLGYDHETDENKWDAAAKKINCKL